MENKTINLIAPKSEWASLEVCTKLKNLGVRPTLGVPNRCYYWFAIEWVETEAIWEDDGVKVRCGVNDHSFSNTTQNVVFAPTQSQIESLLPIDFLYVADETVAPAGTIPLYKWAGVILFSPSLQTNYSQNKTQVAAELLVLCIENQNSITTWKS